jgi:hypothetical protein
MGVCSFSSTVSAVTPLSHTVGHPLFHSFTKSNFPVARFDFFSPLAPLSDIRLLCLTYRDFLSLRAVPPTAAFTLLYTTLIVLE